jgi:hypothetical protein
MSFLIDPPWLYANGRAIAQAAPPERQKPLALATLAVFLTASVGLYLDRGWTMPIWRLCRARSGRDWMLNSGVLRLDADRVGTPTHAVSAALFTTYPFWLWLGLRHGRG